MKYTVPNVSISASSEEIAAIKIALAVLAWTNGADNGNHLVKTLREIPMKEIQDLANDIDKLNPKNAK
ncbi:TPA: hypothetical protein ACNHZZ_001489 [Proteus mirabilis]